MADETDRREGGNIAGVAAAGLGGWGGYKLLNGVRKEATDPNARLDRAVELETKANGSALKEARAAIHSAAEEHIIKPGDLSVEPGKTGLSAVKDRVATKLNRGVDAVTDRVNGVKESVGDAGARFAGTETLESQASAKAAAGISNLSPELMTKIEKHNNFVVDTRKRLLTSAEKQNVIYTQEELANKVTDQTAASRLNLAKEIDAHVISKESTLLQAAEKEAGLLQRGLHGVKINSVVPAAAAVVIGGLGYMGAKKLFSHRVQPTPVPVSHIERVAAQAAQNQANQGAAVGA